MEGNRGGQGGWRGIEESRGGGGQDGRMGGGEEGNRGGRGKRRGIEEGMMVGGHTGSRGE